MSFSHSTIACVPRGRQLSKLDRLAARAVLDRLARWRHGRLLLTLPDGGAHELGSDAPGARRIALGVHDWRFFRRLLLGGDIGAGESYVDGDWSCSDLVGLCALVVEDQSVLGERSAWHLGSRAVHAVRRLSEANTLRGSRRNIRRHYDLSNDFFRLFLDESMTYSAGVFTHPAATLAEAQREKLDGICRTIDLRAGQHVLEIGSGWGSFALHAAEHYGARVTSLTLSTEQQRLAVERVAAAGLQGQVDIQLRDYRAVRGRFDHIVSIEMFEAVGFEYYDAFFGACERLLAPAGCLFLQTIAIPDQRFDRYRRTTIGCASTSSRAPCWPRCTASPIRCAGSRSCASTRCATSAPTTPAPWRPGGSAFTVSATPFGGSASTTASSACGTSTWPAARRRSPFAT
jgi:cyclopropane-fatty-acyl-phospholipid synthase